MMANPAAGNARYSVVIEFDTTGVDRGVQNVRRGLDRVNKTTDKTNRKFKEMGKTTGGAASALNSLKGGLAALGGMAVIHQVSQMTKYFAEFDKGIRQIKALGPVATLEEIEEQIWRTSDAFGGNTKDIIKAYYDTLSAGMDEKGVDALLGAAMRLKDVAVGDLPTAIDLMTSIINAYGMSVEEAERVTDHLAYTVKKGKITLAEMGFLGQLIPQAASFEIPLEEILATISIATAGGVRPRQAVTGVREAISNIAKPAEDARLAAKALGIEWDLASLKAKGWIGTLQDVSIAFEELQPRLPSMISELEDLKKKTGELDSDQEMLLETLIEFRDAGIEGVFNRLFNSISAGAPLALAAGKNIGKTTQALKEFGDNAGYAKDTWDDLFSGSTSLQLEYIGGEWEHIKAILGDIGSKSLPEILRAMILIRQALQVMADVGERVDSTFSKISKYFPAATPYKTGRTFGQEVGKRVESALNLAGISTPKQIEEREEIGGWTENILGLFGFDYGEKKKAAPLPTAVHARTGELVSSKEALGILPSEKQAEPGYPIEEKRVNVPKTISDILGEAAAGAGAGAGAAGPSFEDTKKALSRALQDMTRAWQTYNDEVVLSNKSGMEKSIIELEHWRRDSIYHEKQALSDVLESYEFSNDQEKQLMEQHRKTLLEIDESFYAKRSVIIRADQERRQEEIERETEQALAEQRRYAETLEWQAHSIKMNVDLEYRRNVEMREYIELLDRGLLTQKQFYEVVRQSNENIAQAQREITLRTGDWMDGLVVGMQETAEIAKHPAYSFRNTWTESIDAVNSSLVDFIETGKFGFDELRLSILRAFNTAVVEQFTSSLTSSMLTLFSGGGMSGFSNFFGFGGAGSSLNKSISQTNNAAGTATAMASQRR